MVNRIEYILNRIVANATNVTVASTIGGDYVMPFPGFLKLAGATVDTAGTTGDTTIDIKKNGVSVFVTKITINSGSTTSRTATVKPLLDATKCQFITGDIFTFDVTTVSTTAPKGLTVFMNVIDVSTS